MKTAFFVMGPESSGTRMLTKAFCTLGIYGDYKHKQRMDDFDFSETPNKIVFRRSLPHGDRWPDVAGIVNRMRQAGYKSIVPILIVRDKDMTVNSQIRHEHAEKDPESRGNIEFSIDHSYKTLAEVGLSPVVIHYEPFVKYESVRKMFFQSLGLREPTMAFYDANDQYKGNREEESA